MGRCLAIAVILTVSFLMYSMTDVAIAQEEEIEYSYGRVSSISTNQIVVSEYDFYNDEEVDITYIVPPQAEFINVSSLEEINVGASIDIEYVIKDDKRIAKTITVEIPYEEESEYSPGEME